MLGLGELPALCESHAKFSPEADIVGVVFRTITENGNSVIVVAADVRSVTKGQQCLCVVWLQRKNFSQELAPVLDPLGRAGYDGAEIEGIDMVGVASEDRAASFVRLQGPSRLEIAYRLSKHLPPMYRFHQ